MNKILAQANLILLFFAFGTNALYAEELINLSDFSGEKFSDTIKSEDVKSRLLSGSRFQIDEENSFYFKGIKQYPDPAGYGYSRTITHKDFPITDHALALELEPGLKNKSLRAALVEILHHNQIDAFSKLSKNNKSIITDFLMMYSLRIIRPSTPVEISQKNLSRNPNFEKWETIFRDAVNVK
ncbi:MAG: hypothetical protein ACOYL6_09055 [Bacteriovoracaceae bacterium]